MKINETEYESTLFQKFIKMHKWIYTHTLTHIIQWLAYIMKERDVAAID